MTVSLNEAAQLNPDSQCAGGDKTALPLLGTNYNYNRRRAFLPCLKARGLQPEDFDDLDAAITVATANKNVFLGTTILRFHRRWGDDPNTVVPTEVKTAVDTLGPEKIVFGSNLPEYRPIQVINALKRLELGDDAEALIFGDNLARIYGLEG